MKEMGGDKNKAPESLVQGLGRRLSVGWKGSAPFEAGDEEVNTAVCRWKGVHLRISHLASQIFLMKEEAGLPAVN